MWFHIIKDFHIRSELAEEVAGIGGVAGADVVGLAHDALHANLIGRLVGVDVALIEKEKIDICPVKKSEI